MKIYLIILFGVSIILFNSCHNEDRNIGNREAVPKTAADKVEIKNIKRIPDTLYRKERTARLNNKLLLILDTMSLKKFWNDFQNNIKTNNKRKVIDVLEFPVHAVCFTSFQFAYDCDTSRFIKNEARYQDIDINTNNVMHYYDFMFSEILKEMILNTSLDDLLKKSSLSDERNFTYAFFPRDYKVKGRCSLDHCLYFYFHLRDKNWTIAIGGL